MQIVIVFGDFLRLLFLDIFFVHASVSFVRSNRCLLACAEVVLKILSNYVFGT